MPKVTYIEFDGTPHEVDVPVGQSLMQGAVNQTVPGILADCGGVCACATCHVYVDESWTGRVGPADDGESDMLEVVDARRPGSRLSCQLAMREDLDGLILHLPESQG